MLKDNKILVKLIKDMLKQEKENSYYTEYGEGYKQGYIDSIKDILKLIV